MKITQQMIEDAWKHDAEIEMDEFNQEIKDLIDDEVYEWFVGWTPLRILESGPFAVASANFIVGIKLGMQLAQERWIANSETST